MTQCDNPTPSLIPTRVQVMSHEAIPTQVQVHHHTHWLDRMGWDGMGFHTCTCTFGCQTIHYTIIPWYQHIIWQCTTYPLSFRYPPLPSSHRVLSHTTRSLHHVVFNQDNSMIWQTPLWSSIDVAHPSTHTMMYDLWFLGQCNNTIVGGSKAVEHSMWSNPTQANPSQVVIPSRLPVIINHHLLYRIVRIWFMWCSDPITLPPRSPSLDYTLPLDHTPPPPWSYLSIMSILYRNKHWSQHVIPSSHHQWDGEGWAARHKTR